MRNETLGQIFQRYRKAERLNLNKVEQETRISKRILEAIEKDDYDKFPDEVYAKNLIKSYAKYLSLDYNRLLNIYEQNKKNKSPEPEPTKKFKVYLTPKRIQIILISLIIAAVLIYLGWQVKQIFEPPNLLIFEPAQDLIIEETFIDIKGQTEKGARIFINEKEVFIDPQGNFNATLDLQKGLNIIKISAAKENSKTNVIFREILVQ